MSKKKKFQTGWDIGKGEKKSWIIIRKTWKIVKLLTQMGIKVSYFMFIIDKII